MIKVKNITKKAGFTKEQLQDIGVRIVDILNSKKNIKYFEYLFFVKFKKDIKKAYPDKLFRLLYEVQLPNDVVIDVKGTTCRYTINNSYECIFNFLARIGVKITSDLLVENKTFDKIKKLKCDGVVYETPDAWSDGNFMISKEYGGAVDSDMKAVDIGAGKITLKSFVSNELIKIDNYNKVSKIKSKKDKQKYFIIYRDSQNYKVFNQKYVDFFKKDCEFYLTKDKIKLLAIKEGKVVGGIMGLDNNYTDFNDFELVPTIENTAKDEIINKNQVIKEENIVKYPIIVYQNNKTNVADEHKNAVTGHIYAGNNAELLSKAGYKVPLWVGRGQARKLNKQIRSDAKGVVIRIYYEDDSGRSFCKLETVYNVAELEPIRRIENTSDYKNMIERLKAV